MSTWDTFSSDEVTLFANLHTKATKFPFPSNIKQRPVESEIEVSNNVTELKSKEEVDFQNITAHFEHLQQQHLHYQNVLRNMDLLLEAHRQLCILSQVKDDTPSDSSLVSPSAEKGQLLAKLAQVQEQIALLDERQKAEAFIKAAILPSLTASPTYFDALKSLQVNGLSPAIVEKTKTLMSRCWANTMTAMERVLEMDLDTIEAYIDDRSYVELKDRVLKPLLKIVHMDPSAFQESLNLFASEYVQLRQNSIRFLVDERLNRTDSVFLTSPPEERILHLIERCRLLLQVEAREFDNLFGSFYTKSLARNQILETVGNLMYARIEQLSGEVSDKRQISSFIQSLMEYLLQQGLSNDDPFSFFLQLLQSKLFPLIVEEIVYTDDVIEV